MSYLEFKSRHDDIILSRPVFFGQNNANSVCYELDCWMFSLDNVAARHNIREIVTTITARLCRVYYLVIGEQV